MLAHTLSEYVNGVLVNIHNRVRVCESSGSFDRSDTVSCNGDNVHDHRCVAHQTLRVVFVVLREARENNIFKSLIFRKSSKGLFIFDHEYLQKVITPSLHREDEPFDGLISLIQPRTTDSVPLETLQW